MAEPVPARLLPDHDRGEGVEAAAAELLRHVEAPQPELAGLGTERAQDVVGKSQRSRAEGGLRRHDALGNEARDELAQRFELPFRLEPGHAQLRPQDGLMASTSPWGP